MSRKTKATTTESSETLQVDSTTTLVSGTTSPSMEMNSLTNPELVLKINPFLENMGREDLHKLRDKINEVIDFINKQ